MRCGIKTCNDINEFDLLGKLNKMLQNTPDLKIQLNGHSILAHSSALEMFERRDSRTVVPSNQVNELWIKGKIRLNRHTSTTLSELLIDHETYRDHH